MERSIYNNYSEARAALYEDVLGPAWSCFAATLTHRLLPEFPGTPHGAKVKMDLSGVPAHEAAKVELIKVAAQVVKDGFLTVPEGRALAGFGPMTKGETLYIPTLISPTTVGESDRSQRILDRLTPRGLEDDLADEP